jgi:dynein heavy chain
VNVKHPDPASHFIPEWFYEEIAARMEDVDPPAAYGQHINAEITSQILDSSELLESILGLTPQKATGGGDSGDGGQVKLIQDLDERLPELIDVTALKHKLRGDENPLNVVLVQEIQRYNVLLRSLRVSMQ